MKVNPRSTFASAVLPLLFVLLVLGPFSLAFGQETHPGGTWGAWLTLPQYPKLQMRVKCEYWITDQNDNNRAHSVWAIQYRSGYVRPMDVVQANTYYDTVLNRNKNWNAPGQFTIQPGQTADYGETSVLGACPKAGGASPINLAVYCVVPSGQVDQSPSCQAHGVPKVQEPGSATASGASSSAGAGTPAVNKKARSWICEGGYFVPTPNCPVATCGGVLGNRTMTKVFTSLSDNQRIGDEFSAWYRAQHPDQNIPQNLIACTSFDSSEVAESIFKSSSDRKPLDIVDWSRK